MGSRVLIVDDSIGTRALIGRVLERAGHVVTQAADGREALAALSVHRFDVILTDQWMPNMTGVELVHAVRAIPELGDIPVVAITTDADDALPAELDEAGVSECVSKPFEPADLLAIIERLTEG